MSVINKVLRDLDKRQGAATATSVEVGGVRSGTTSVMASERPGARTPAKSKTGPVAVWGGLLLVLVGSGALWQIGALDGLISDDKPKAISQAIPLPVPPVPPASAPLPPPVELAPEPLALEPASRFDDTLSVPKDLRIAAMATPAPTPAKTQLRVPEVKVATAPSAPVAAVAAPAVAPVPTAAEMAQKQQSAGRDALAHAQALWNAGSHDAAVDLLQQAAASAERVAISAPSAANTQTLALLVRELGRMQLSEGRPGVVWETLTRLEPLLREQPDMWALRANAAQRMGRHQDSVHAYMTALQIRPTEQRWLLGTAVSLAALGQTASAAEMAEKARVAGPISKDVQTYLRQMGVPLKE